MFPNGLPQNAENPPETYVSDGSMAGQVRLVQSVLIVMNMNGKNGEVRLAIVHAVFHGYAPFAVRS